MCILYTYTLISSGFADQRRKQKLEKKRKTTINHER